MRRVIADAVGALGSKDVSTELIAILDDAWMPASIRGRVAVALGQLGERRCLPKFLAPLEDRHIDRAMWRDVAATMIPLADRSSSEYLPRIAVLLPSTGIPNPLYDLAQHMAGVGGQIVTPEQIGLPTIEHLWVETSRTERIVDQLP